MSHPKPLPPTPERATNCGPATPSAAVSVAAPAALPAAATAAPSAIAWPGAARQAAFEAWLAPLAATHGLRPESLRPASADASFRRYLRIDRAAGGSCIVMDAPPELEDCRPFVRVQALMAAAGLRVPQILAWDEADGFMLLSDLGAHTLIEALAPAAPAAAQGWYLQAVEVLIEWQKASRPGVLPAYDEALLRRELALFPDWYLVRHRGIQLDEAQQNTLARAFDAIVAHSLAAPSVFVHRDFMPRNLMLPTREGEPLGVLDFQDAVYGPITYDIASLLRDAFISWDEEFVIDITVRYWEKARRAGLLGAASASGWGADFGDFYRSVEWMGLQRHLKVAGIFARLTLRDGKPKYLADAPRFIAYIRATASRYRELAPLLRLLDQIEGVQEQSGWAFGRVS
ncbi:aminoglycoside phosphotransferase family protein [Extensimonas vulgaris]|uniref:Aminoglycoside phosphotransferase domain-containing protein n=1 Tax=Extensimonas vulgaris TaxID=1031594 RepID=A0A369ADX4_9BURK|nr:phosphotransferase [Extensimonas vulgaris]RCX07560.1 hypothetical protein DFR45_11322 [Extensimonas vulgaris]TWI41450.1 hypothetical protein IP95_00209 [Extensimonas vulgaris]TXD12920.1 phosphotransferase [Extensimonas vulgaris]